MCKIAVGSSRVAMSMNWLTSSFTYSWYKNSSSPSSMRSTLPESVIMLVAGSIEPTHIAS